MIDIHTHDIIDMIASREQKEVVMWLKSYSNLKVVIEVVVDGHEITLVETELSQANKNRKLTLEEKSQGIAIEELAKREGIEL